MANKKVTFMILLRGFVCTLAPRKLGKVYLTYMDIAETRPYRG